jgi:hypothetical protein
MKPVLGGKQLPRFHGLTGNSLTKPRQFVKIHGSLLIITGPDPAYLILGVIIQIG